MSIQSLCEIYFLSPTTILKNKESTRPSKVLAIAFIVSYFTIIIPAGLGLALGVSKLVDRCKELKCPNFETAKFYLLLVVGTCYAKVRGAFSTT